MNNDEMRDALAEGIKTCDDCGALMGQPDLHRAWHHMVVTHGGLAETIGLMVTAAVVDKTEES